jgi:hypothetical protein
MFTSTEILMTFPWEIKKSLISNSKCNTVVIDTQSLEHGFVSWSSQTKDYIIDICYLSAKQE